jgi:hypothetical protein
MFWYLDLAIVGLTVVGRIHQLPTEGTAGPGQVKQVGKWTATGMAAEWSDTPLGETFSTRAEAMRAVSNWHEQGKKKATTTP